MSEVELRCINHPDRETLLRCGKCGQPFCTSCLVQTPVGLRCRPCANIRRSPIYDVSTPRLLWAATAGLASAVGGGIVFFAVVGALALWLSWLYGIAIGEVVSWAARHKRGPSLQVVTGLCIALGAVLGKYGLAFASSALAGAAAGARLGFLLEAAGRDIWLMLFVLIAVVAGISRVR